MAVKIRLKRMGKKGTPFYRLVVMDESWRRDGKTIEDIGWYDPVKNPAQVSIKEDRVYYWMDKGALTSETARSLLKQHGYWEKFKNGDYKQVLADALAVKAEKVAAVKAAAAPKAKAQPVVETPVEAQPIEAQPIEAQPVEAQPVEAQPVEAQPVEAQPVEAQPVEAQPVEAQDTPAESPSVKE